MPLSRWSVGTAEGQEFWDEMWDDAGHPTMGLYGAICGYWSGLCVYILHVITNVDGNSKHQNIGIPTKTKGIWSENQVFFWWIAKTKPGSIENLPIGMLEAQAGVRNLQKHIERICRKMATKVMEQWEGRLGLSGLVSQNHAELLVRSRYFWQTNCSRLVVWRCWDVVR